MHCSCSYACDVNFLGLHAICCDYHGIALIFINVDAFGWMIIMELHCFLFILMHLDGIALVCNEFNACACDLLRLSWLHVVWCDYHGIALVFNEYNACACNLLRLSWNCIGFHSFRCIWMNFDANCWFEMGLIASWTWNGQNE